MILGLTGTRHGVSPHQDRQLRSLLRPWYGQITEFHHGCCVGADYDAHRIVLGHVPIHAHPPDLHRYLMPQQAIAQASVTYAEMSYHARNRAIVDACDMLLVVPCEAQEQERGGTWGTFRYARDVARKPALLLWP